MDQDDVAGTEEKKQLMNWYRETSEQKNVTQIVLQAGLDLQESPKFGSLVLSSKFMPLLANTWVTGFFYLDSDPGPFIMVRADEVAHKLKGSAVTAARLQRQCSANVGRESPGKQPDLSTLGKRRQHIHPDHHVPAAVSATRHYPWEHHTLIEHAASIPARLQQWKR